MALSVPAYPCFERLVWRRFGAALKAGRMRPRASGHAAEPDDAEPDRGEALQAPGVPFVLGPAERRRALAAAVRCRAAGRAGVAFLRARGLQAACRVGATCRRPRPSSSARATPMARCPSGTGGQDVYLPENAIDPARFPRSRRGTRRTGRSAASSSAGWCPTRAPTWRLRRRRRSCGDGRHRARYRRRRADAARPSRPRLPRRGASEIGGDLPRHPAAPRRARTAMARSTSCSSRRSASSAAASCSRRWRWGVVPLVVDYAGPGELVSPATGIAVPMADRAGIVAAVGAALDRLAGDPRRGGRDGGRAARRG